MEAQRRGGEDEEGEGEEQTPGPSVFPLFPLSSDPSPSDPPYTGGPQWLSNSSFTFDISSLPRSGSGGVHREEPDSPESDAEASGDPVDARPPPSSYGLIPSSPSGSSSEDERRLKHKERKRRKRKREKDKFDDGAPRKSGVRAWAGSNTKPAKDYYFDSHGDMDNLAFGCLYRMDIARYKIQNNSKTHGNKFWALCGWRTSASNMDIEGDQDILDNKLKSGGRYYSVKFTTLERNKNFRNLKFVNKVIPSMIPEDFVPLSESHSSSTSVPSTNGELEESWEDEVIRRTREFNKMSRDCPNDEKVWLAFAEFQDKIASTQPQKAARLQMLEKKISILEKAVELNPNSEDLLLCLLKSYQGRDSIDTAMEKWERILMQHSDSCKLWKEFLLVCQGDFSRFRVSQIRRIYAHAIQALASACDKHRRQESASLQSADPSIVQLELGLIDIFVSYCRFEWQAGYQELATGLFQAEIEYSLFSPSLVLSSHSKQRLFEHFWKSGVARIGEDGALGWSSWLEKDEQIRQKVISEDRSSEKDVGGWSGWFQLAKRRNSTGEEHKVEKESDLDDEKASENLGSEENPDAEEIPPIDDIEALLKKMGIDIDAEPHSEVKDTETWNRWATEELLRDNEQWMPIHKNSGVTGQTTSLYSDDKIDKDDGEQLSRVILFEDVSDYLFSLSSKEAYLSLVCQFIDFYGGKISQWVNTNKSSWSERILSLEAVPETIVDDLRVVFQLVNKTQDSSHFLLETLLSHSSTSSRTNMMKLLRNAILLCLDVLPQNHVLEESLLFAEELFVSKMNSSTCSINPSRALAKSLLKKDRQDLLFCGVYARTEATFGNIDVARKIFDMALLSIDSLPMDLKKNIPLLYFWYADMEIAMSTSSSDSELCTQRAVHILSCSGGNMKYTPFNCQISPLQILKARQGFKEQIKSLRPTWARGAIEEHSIALICAASLFEILTNDWSSGIQVIEDAFSMVLPERRSQSLQLECLWLYFIKVLERHLKQLRFSRVWKAAEQGYQTYPYNPKSYRAMLRVNYLYSVSSKVRRFFDEYCKTYPSVIMYLFALSFEIGGTGSKHRIHSLFERAITNDKLQKSVLLWRCYLEYETRIAQNPSAARRIFFRAIHACPWSKRLWLDGFQKLSSVLSAKELSDLQEVMRDKELNLRTDIYEILLQDEMPA